MDDPFYQMIEIDIRFDRAYSAGEINRLMRGLGASLFYDVYSFVRSDEGPIWQSESYAYTTLYRNGDNVSAHESADNLVLRYPLATISSEFISRFAAVAAEIASTFNGKMSSNGETILQSGIVELCDRYATKLLEEWGEEPGSESLRILIEQNYGPK